MTQTVDQEQKKRLNQLMQEIAENRSQQAFSEVFDYFAPKVKAFSLSKEPGANLVADDLVQEVMIRVWQKAHTFDGKKAQLSTWIYTLARNARIDSLRKNGKYASEIDPEMIFDTLEDNQPDPFTVAQQKGVKKAINDNLTRLPIDQHQALSKVYLEGKSHQEVSDELNLPLGTVKSRVRLGLTKLNVMMREAL